MTGIFFLGNDKKLIIFPQKKKLIEQLILVFFFSLKKKKTNVSLKKFKMKFTLSYRRETTFAFEIY